MTMQATEDKKEVKSKPQDLTSVLRQNVLNCLGKPKDLFTIKVINIYDDRYRVNVFCHVENQLHITDSFYLLMGEHGEITGGDVITKKYGDK